jgi:hypothetical protein
MAKFSLSAAGCYYLLGLAVLAHGQVADLDKLIKESDVVAVAQVMSVEQTGSGSIELARADFGRLSNCETALGRTFEGHFGF